MSLSKNQLLEINGLELSGIVNNMDDSQIEEYCKTLLDFTEKFPAQEAELKKLFNFKDYNVFSMVLLGIRDVLEKIYAASLARNCIRLLEELKSQKYNIVEAHLTYVLAEISELSIDIQMAWQKDKAVNETELKEFFVEKGEAYAEDNEQKRILAVDDVSLTLNALKLALCDTNYKFVGVKSGTDALKFINNHRPDLFILDIEMPEMNGYELADKIRRSGQTAPIIFLTGNANQEYVIKAIAAGAADFIVKPVNKENVIEKIRKYIG